MQFNTVLTVAALAAVTCAQYGYDSPSAAWPSSSTSDAWAPTSAAPAVAAPSQTSESWADWAPSSAAPALAAPSQAGEMLVQVVEVGGPNGSLTYWPDQVQAAPGTIVQFRFNPRNHTISESSFASPCKFLAANLTSPTRPGLRSGFVPVTGMESFQTVYNVLINDTKPIWIYCGQVHHCQKGMSMVINQNMTDTVHTLQNYQAAAAALPDAAASSPAASGGSYSSAWPSYGTPASPAATSETLTPPVASTPPPFAGPSLATTTTGAVPAVFTGAANKQDAYRPAGLAGLLLAGVFVVL